MLKIGIECESIEGQTWGVGRIVNKLLENIAARPELVKEFRFFLYFKSHIPKIAYLDNPIFVKKIIGTQSFSLYYYIFLPIKLWFERLDLMFFPNYMLPIIFKGKSLVMLTEDIYCEIKNGTLPMRYRLAYKIFAGWWAAKHANNVLAISETSKKELVNLFGIDHKRIVVNPLGIDPPKKQMSTNHSLSVNGYILYVGQAFPRRHLRETILAFEIIAKEFPDLKLVAIGKDKYNPPTIPELVQKTNNQMGRDAIIYKEYVSEQELADLYTKAELIVYVSSKEAFGLPPLEALSYGVPAVVTDSEISHEIFGGNAFFVKEPASPESIAPVMEEALTNHAKREKIKNAREGILQKYTWQKHTDRFLEIIRMASN